MRKIFLYIGAIATTLAGLAFWLAYETPEKTLAAGTEDVVPNATAAEAGGSCTTANAHTNMDDDPDGAGDGNVCNADSNTANHDIRLNFGVPVDSDPLDTATDAQVFAVRAINSNPGGNQNATVALDFYCNGSLTEAGTDQTIGDSYAVYSEAFTIGACAAADVEVLIDCTAKDVGGTGNDTSCNYEAVEWEATTAAASSPAQPRQSVYFFE